MKILFWGLVLTYSVSLYAVSTAPTDKEENIQESPMSACTEDIKGKCKDKTGDKMVECLQHSSNKECADAVQKKPVSCPPNPCELDYGKIDADKIFACNLAFNEKNPACSAKSAKP